MCYSMAIRGSIVGSRELPGRDRERHLTVIGATTPNGLAKGFVPSSTRPKVCSYTFQPDETVMFAGDGQDRLFLIKSGWVRLYRLLPDDRTIVLGLLGPGEVFMQDDPHHDGEQPTSADALTPCEITEVPFAKVGAVLARSPEYSRKLLGAFRRRQTASHDHIEEVLTRDTSRRLASILIELARAVGIPTDQPRIARISRAATHQSLANMIGSNRVTVTRKLIEMHASGMVRSLGRNSIEVDVDALHAYLHGVPPSAAHEAA